MSTEDGLRFILTSYESFSYRKIERKRDGGKQNNSKPKLLFEETSQ